MMNFITDPLLLYRTVPAEGQFCNNRAKCTSDAFSTR